MGLKFGLFYLFSDFGDVSQQQVFKEVLDEIEYAEELGFDSVWLPEHHFAVYGMLGNPMTFAAAVSQRTHRIKIATAIMVLPFQHPLRLAEDAALVDVLSNGRLLLGVGRGYQPPEFHGFGVPQEASSEMFLESFEIVRRALSGERFAYNGRFWKIEEPTEIFPKPIQRPYPPFYMASISPPSLEVAAKLGVSIMRAPQFSDLNAVSKAFDSYKQKMRAYGHDPDKLDQPLSLRIYVTPTDEEAKAASQDATWFYHTLAKLLPGAPGRPRPPAGYENYPLDPSVLSKVTPDDVWERGTCMGSPERVTQLMKMYIRKTGATSVLCWMRVGALGHKKVVRSMELFTKHVKPALEKEFAKVGTAVPV